MNWRSRALETGRQIADADDRWFSQDDITDAVGPPDPDHEPNGKASSAGTVLSQLEREGVVYTDGRTVRSRQSSRKGGRQLLWRGARWRDVSS